MHGRPLGYVYFDELAKKDFKWPVDSLEGSTAAGDEDAMRIHGYGKRRRPHMLFMTLRRVELSRRVTPQIGLTHLLSTRRTRPTSVTGSGCKGRGEIR